MKYMIVTTESFQSGNLPDEVSAFLESHSKPFIILDESSKIKSNKASQDKKKSKRCQAIQRLNRFGHRTILTGTFMSKSPVNAYDQMEFLKKDYWKENMFSFESTYCIMIRLPIGRGIRTLIPEEVYMKIRRGLERARKNGTFEQQMQSYGSYYCIGPTKLLHILNHPEYTPYMNVDAVYRRISNDVMIVKKKDALGLPEKVYKRIRLAPTAEMTKLYKQLLEVGFTEDYVSKGNGLSLYHRFQDIVNGYIPKQASEDDPVTLERQKENIKVSAVLDELEDIDTSTSQVVVWSNRKLLLKDLYDAISKDGIVACMYDGDTPDSERKQIEQDFRSGKIRVFIGNQASGAYGLDWLKKADYAIFVSNDHSVERREQAEDRIHRGGIGDVSKTIIDIVVSGTVDERVQESLRVGKELIHSAKTDRAVFDMYDVVW